jgi:hypothetical protein
MSRKGYIEKIDSPLKSLGKLVMQNSLDFLNTGDSASIQQVHSVEHTMDKNFNSNPGLYDSLYDSSIERKNMKFVENNPGENT